MATVIEKSLDSLTSIVNVATGMAHPLDESRAKELFKALHQKGFELTAEEVEHLALERSWSNRHVKALGKLAEKIGNGGRVQINHPRDWGEPTVERILNDIHGENS